MSCGELRTIPHGYDRKSHRAGVLEVLSYDTYEAFSYHTDSPCPLRKEAIIYLPHGYSPEKKYPVVYISHGGWAYERTLMGGPGAPTTFTHIIDHAIAHGDIVPMIIVNLTYNNTSPQDSSDFDVSIELTRRYHNELINDLIPAVEGKYSTFAQTTSPEDLIAARKYRAFSGFSMGSVNTWRTFENALEYFYYFNPMSGSSGIKTQELVHMLEKKKEEFFIYAVSGTEDFAYKAFKEQILSLCRQAPHIFIPEENIIFRERKGGVHDYHAIYEYTYNALMNIFK